MTGVTALMTSYGGSSLPTLVYDLDAANFAELPVVGGSINFNGTSQYVKTSGNAGTAMDTGDFTWEAWIYPTLTTSSRTIIETRGLNTGASAVQTDGAYFGFVSGSLVYFRSAAMLTSSITPTTNTWSHVALVRNAGTTTIYVNGASGGTYVDSLNHSSQPVQVGAGGSGGYGQFAGQITNLRMVKGTAVYTGTFTPPTQPLNRAAGTQLLLLASTSAGLITDSSANAFTLTNPNTVTYNAGTPFTAVKDATGTYTMTASNAGSSISWQSANGGVFRKSNNVGTDVIYGGPDYVTGQSYTVFMAYKRIATADGRLLNTQSEASKDWLMGLYNGHDQTFYPNFAVNLPSSGADLFWHLDFATWNTSTGLGQLYSATSSSPSSVTFSATNAGGGGFNQLRLFSRSSGSEVQTADIGFIKVYNGVLTLANVQSLYTTYKTRFGY
jgi:hypothetical protein